MLTGRHEFRNGLTHTIHERERLVPGAVMLAQTLRGVGVRRGFLESGTSGNEPAYGPSARGFQEMFIHGAGDRADDPGSCGDAPGSTYFHPAEAHRQVVEVLGAAYEKWWAEVEPQLVDEGVKVPAVNPFREP